MRGNSGRPVGILLLIAAYVCLGAGPAGADDNLWLIGHWEGHNTKNLGDTRHFALDVATVKSDQSFAAQWTVNGKVSSGEGKIEANAIDIQFPSGHSVSLFRATDGSLAGSTAAKDGTPGITLVFAKSGSAASAPSGAANSDKTCAYHEPTRKGAGPTLQANNGDVVVTREGPRKCVDGRLRPAS